MNRQPLAESTQDFLSPRGQGFVGKASQVNVRVPRKVVDQVVGTDAITFIRREWDSVDDVEKLRSSVRHIEI
jgi:hypothetical protein